jgi:hypothetical protein
MGISDFILVMFGVHAGISRCPSQFCYRVVSLLPFCIRTAVFGGRRSCAAPTVSVNRFSMAPKTPPKRKAKPEDDPEDFSDEEKEEKPKKKAKPRAKKEQVPTEPFTGSHGWEVEPTLFLLSRYAGAH